MSYSTFTILMKKFISFGQTKLIHYIRPLVSIDDVLAEISEKPTHMGFEVTNICNAKCIFCGYQYLKRPKTILPMDLFKKAIDEFDAFGGGSIGFNPVVGDPLIDPNIIERIQYARSKKNIRRIGLFTNGILINKIGVKGIISSGINDIIISIGGFDRETYSRVFRVNRWDSVYEGVLNLLEENELCDNKVNICIALRSDVPIWKSLKKPAYKDLKRYKFDLQFSLLYFDNWSGRIKQENLTGTMRLRNPSKKSEPCSILYRVPKILSNGNMTLCGCRDLNGDSELVLGNIRDRSILEMWRDPRVENIRKGFYSSRYPKICLDCSMYNDLSFFRKERLKALLRGENTQGL
jgi:MoaA/NifB/PqqE/SkfB family radical SAM enzyme